uniref:U3 small nucleolar RNA-associated protein 15 homolog n=1 Tax=Corethrella appendiculata TaxID=1370023 RepID=U5ESK1_9DIPT
MQPFKKTQTNLYRKPAQVLTPESLYWKKFKVPVLVKEFGAIDYIDFSPVEPYNFAVTSSVRVQIYNPVTKLVVKNLSKFQECAYGGSFRKDGKLLVAGDEQSRVRLFDVTTKNILRLFEGHKAAVHRTYFTSDGVHVASFSDDSSVKIWDIPTEKAIHTFQEHTDYVRAGCVNPASPFIVFSGGYDNLIKMYDTRSNRVAFTVDHGHPIESIVCLPNGGAFISAGGKSINIWDSFSGGKLMAQISQHHKTVTCLELVNGNRLISGSLDRHVKVYDIPTREIVHSIECSNSILSVGMSKDDETFVTGTVDGLIAIYRQESLEEESKQKIDKSGFKKRYTNVLKKADEIIPRGSRTKTPRHDVYLRKYQYIKAMDTVLIPYNINTHPEVIVAVIRELIHRKGLRRTFENRTPAFLCTLIKFFNRHIGNYYFTPVIIDACNILLDIYEDKFHQFAGTNVEKLFKALKRKLTKEREVLLKFLEIQGMIDMLSAATNCESSENTYCSLELKTLKASAMAEKLATINID